VKKNNNLIIGILLISLAVLLLIYFTLTGENHKRYQWAETYKSTSDQPYGTLFIQKLLAGYRPGHNFIFNDNKPLSKLLDTAKLKTKTDYVLIGNDLFLDEEDKKTLLTFVSSGNDAFIATINLPMDVIDPVFNSECGAFIELAKDSSRSVQLNFYNNNLKTEEGFTYAFRFGPTDQPYFWNALVPGLFCDSTRLITPLGYIKDDKVNFFRLAYGKGNIYLHTNPLVFTNYFLADRNKTKYASSVFSHLNGQTLIWDEFSKSQFNQRNNAPPINPLAYILQQESLRYAWWLMLTASILYVWFTTKRKQRVIPVLDKKVNTSLEFVEMISALHYQNDNPLDIARKKMKYFFYFIRGKYGIHTQNLTEANLTRLSEKTKMALADLKEIAHEFKRTDNVYYTTLELTSLYKALEKFYKHCN
jgi:hypothetical protein